ncbi:hypothetical protein Taro_008629 [Colocasia esculenta]|uniref:DNA repair protein UVH3 n=1 Tax=Colocasia esculenta TaxID=4460 RepID=A0A843U7J9_COLES|nr:hypothetical protein [Colocasia esculenta]
MGVQGLWELLAPVGRRVSVETLAGKKLAIDASIWMVQFMKAMRDEKGEMVRNAHLLGFFRRICKLLFLRSRPVFVFDGGTPALKRRTVAARRRHRENARAKIRKTAEKLLLNHLKAKKLEDLAAELKNSRAKDYAKGKGVVSEHENHVAGSSIPEGADKNGLGAISQEGLDEMLAASLAAEEEGNFSVDEPASSGKFPAEVGEDEDEEMSMPVINGNVDPTVLASLPPSMQLDLLVQMRESLMAENRQKYQKIKKCSEFSELQIQSYLKTVAFRKEIDEVQKVAAGRGPEGIQTSRIASEANREFIFSSSFTGDKTVFTSPAVEKNGNAGKIDSYSEKGSASLDSVSVSTSQVNVAGPTKDFGHDIETYLDERGRIRVSRVRGLGIRMTRDLQRNLDLLKEYEIESTERNVYKNLEPVGSKEALSTSHNYSKNDIPINIEDGEEPFEDLHRCQGNNMQKIQKDQHAELSATENHTTLEVSFSEDDNVDRDDDVFSQLVAGSSIVQHSQACSLGKSSIGCESDFEWEEGVIEDRDKSNKTDKENVSLASFEERDGHENDELNWQEGEIQTASAHQIEHVKPFSRGSLEEELEVQEAIRRSLEDLGQQINTVSLHVQTSKMSAVSSSATPLQCDSQSPRQHDLLVDGELSDSAVEGCSLPTFDSVEKLPATTSTYTSTELSVTDVRNFQVTNHANITPSDTDSRIMEKPKPDEAPTTVLVGVQVSKQESCLDTSTKDDDKSSLRIETDVLTPGSSDLCIRNTGKPDGDLNRAHGRGLPSNCQIPEEDYIFDTTVSDGGFHTELKESTLDEELLLLSRERMDLSDEQRKLERNAESVNNEMFAECQELLQMFGLPFIIAPMEAEAQCAYMEQVNLVDGVVTDDSDVFLFGAQNVYKNIFDDRKYVETYLMKDIEKELGLTREMLIRMALLLGSDYTEGVGGIGIVNAIEVVHAFSEEDGLKKFREWVESPDPAILGKLYPHIGGGAKKRSSKPDNGEDTLSIGTKKNDVHSSSDSILDVKRTFMDKHRNVSKNWHIPLSFPSDSVISAYISPQVDESTEPFAWGKPDLPLLRKLCWEKFGWANQKADELLVPVLKEHNKHETQLRLEAFYTFNEKFAKIRSQRIKKAVKGITGSSLIGLTGDLEQGDVKVKKKRRRTSEVEENRDEKHPDGRCDGRKHSRQLVEDESEKKLSDGRLPESLGQSGIVVKETNKSNVNEGRGRGRRRGGKGGKGRKRRTRDIEEHSFESAETSSSGCSYHSTKKEMQVEQTCSSELRRSLRQRKHVQYTQEENVDDDGLSDRPTDKREVCLDEPAAAQELNDISNPDDNKDNNQDINVIGDICDFTGIQATSDRDYLSSGGGFCVYDDDLNDNPTQKMSGAQENPVDTLSNMTSAPDDLDMDMEHSFDGNLKSVQDPLQAAPVEHEETDVFKEQGAGHQTGYGFTAMTSLRRKRK